MVRYDWGVGDGELFVFFRLFVKVRLMMLVLMMRMGLWFLDMVGRRVMDGC